MAKYKMLLGTPVRCYIKNQKGQYQFEQTAYYIGNGYCISSFTDTVDNLKEGIEPYLLKFDRYIPIEMWNAEYYYELQNKGYTHLKPIINSDYTQEDFNIDNIEDLYDGHLDEFWWWKEIQDKIQKEIKDIGCHS